MNLHDCTLLLTRPSTASARFEQEVANAIGKFGNVVVSPLLRIEFLPLDATSIPQTAQLAFSSENGVASAARYPDLRQHRAWCVGRRTAERARAEGFRTETADGDVDALYALLAGATLSGPVVHFAGRHARGDLASRLVQSGTAAETLIAYDQLACPLSTEARNLLTNPVDVVAPVFSPRTARLLFDAAQARQARLHLAVISANTASEWQQEKGERLEIAQTQDARGVICAMIRLFDADPLLETTRCPS